MFNHNVFGCCQFKKIGRNAKSAFDWIKKNIKRKSVNFFKKACYFGAYGPIMFALWVWVGWRGENCMFGRTLFEDCVRKDIFENMTDKTFSANSHISTSE